MIWLVALALAGPLEDGAEAYDQGDWPAAIEAWERIPSPNGKVLYNLGNAHYRSADPARAVAYYRSAARFRPRDGDLAHSLAIARQRLDNPPPPVDPPRLWQSFLTSGELGVLGLLLLGAGSGTGVWQRRRQEPWWGAAIAWGIGVVVVVTAVLGMAASDLQPVVVVVDSEAVVRESARPDARQAFVLPPGSEVRIERSLAGFYRIETGDGRLGWVPTGAVFATALGPAPSEEP